MTQATSKATSTATDQRDSSHLAPPAALTAVQRGPEWMSRYGCTNWCVMDHAGDAGQPGWHQARTATVIAPKPGGEALPGEVPDVLLSACVTQQSQDAGAFGIETRLWFDYGIDTLEMTVEETDQLIDRLERFLPQLHAARDLLVKASAGDRPGDRQAKARRMAEVDAKINAINTQAHREADADLDAFLSEHHVVGAEAPAGQPMPHGVEACYAQVDGTRTIFFAAHATPAARLQAARAALAYVADAA